MKPAQLQSHPSICGFYTIYVALHLFTFCREKINGVEDFIVLRIISDYM